MKENVKEESQVLLARVLSKKEKKKSYDDGIFSFGASKTQAFTATGFLLKKSISLKPTLATEVNAELGHFVGMDQRSPGNMNQRTLFSILPTVEKKDSLLLSDSKRIDTPNNYESHKKLNSNWTENKHYLCHHEKLKTSLEVTNFKRASRDLTEKWLNYRLVKTELRVEPKTEFENVHT